MPATGEERAFRIEPYAYAEARALMEALGVAEPVAVTLVRRGHRTVEEARRFLEASEAHDPFRFEGMAEVVERIRAAIAAGRRITVHGDYDVDGVCSTVILVSALRDLGAECGWFIPDRLGDGYGLTVATVQRLAADGTGLLLTADCGIGSTEEVAAARAAGIEVIVTDHHAPGDELPDCPILHPVVSAYPCPELCATGVAHKLAVALLGEERAERDLDLVALATVADLVPLRGENRALVRRGLAAARATARPGMRALMASAGVRPERLDEGDLAFRLAPRINAAGRLYRADAGVELFLTADADRAAAIAEELGRANRERRDAEEAVLRAAEEARRALPPELAEGPALVLSGRGWHPGVVGIVASRLVERHWRPVVLIGVGEDGRGRGSGRSIPGFDLLGALHACGEHLGRYGGHRAAAGLEIREDAIAAFREALIAHAAAVLPDEALVRAERVDAVVGGESLGLDVAEQLGRLGPFGMGNPGVRLLVPGARIADIRPMGEGDRHARFRLSSGAAQALGVAFGVNGSLAGAAAKGPLDVSLRLEVNEWNGAVEPRVVLGEIYANGAPPGAEPESPGDAEWWRRADAERECELAPASMPEAAAAREVVREARASGIAAVASLASTGEPVLVLCADAERRRALVEHAAAPARFGGGVSATAAGRFALEPALAGVRQVLAAGGIVLADWAMLELEPGLCEGFAHVALVDPPPFAHLEARAGAGEGYLHRLWREGDLELPLRVHEGEWPQRPLLAQLYRELRDGDDALDASAARILLAGPGRYPRSPEVAGRCLRVLEELELAAWEGSGTEGRLRVVSSEGTDLERSRAFAAYRERYEEGRRFLNRPTAPT